MADWNAYTPQRGPEAPWEVPQRKRGGFLRRYWGLLAAVAAAALAAVLLGGPLMARLMPVRTIGRSLAATAEDIQARLEQSPYHALRLFGQALLEGEAGLQWTREDSDGRQSARLTLTSDWSRHALALAGALEQENQSAEGQLYLSSREAAFTVSGLDGWYGAAFSSFDADLRASALELTDEEIAAASASMEQLATLMELDVAGLAEEVSQLYTDFLDGLEFSQRRETAAVGGRELDCTVLTAPVDEEDLSAAMLRYFDCFTGDDALEALAVQSMAAGGLSPEEAQASYRRQLRESRAQWAALLDSMTCDMTLAYYLHGGRAVLCRWEGSMAVDGAPLALQCTLDLGEDPKTDDWRLSLALSQDAGAVLALDAQFRSASDAHRYAGILTATVDDGSGPETLELDTIWDRESGDLTFTLRDGAGSHMAACRLLVAADACAFAVTGIDGGTADLVLTANAGADLEAPAYVPLDQWDEAVLSRLEQAFRQLSNPPEEALLLERRARSDTPWIHS